uniref:Uncharacterized protein n=1 Tax=Anguilla anguilla TaxID=7936 RepID=A0A0E9Q1J3_ANGAN
MYFAHYSRFVLMLIFKPFRRVL